MTELIKIALQKGGKLYPNVSGGKDGQAMVKTLVDNGFPIESLIYCDLGRITWKEGVEAIQRQAAEFGLPVQILKRRDGLDLLDLMERRLQKLDGTGKPFWPSSSARYCTSDTKRDVADVFYRNCGCDLIISAEGIRAQESTQRSKKQPLEIRWRITSDYYKGMTAEQALENYKPGQRLALTWYPVFNFTIEDVFATYGNTLADLYRARAEYKATGIVPSYWKFAAVYVYGNDRLSCKFCIMGSCGDLQNGADHDPELLETLIDMQERSGFLFRKGFDLTTLRPAIEKAA